MASALSLQNSYSCILTFEGPDDEKIYPRNVGEIRRVFIDRPSSSDNITVNNNPKYSIIFFLVDYKGSLLKIINQKGKRMSRRGSSRKNTKTGSAHAARLEYPKYEEKTVRHGESNNKKTDPSCCPVCGQSVRPVDLDSHFIQELEKLYKISSVNRCRRSGQFSTTTDESLENRWEAYLRIKSNRHCRMRMKSRKKKTDDVVCPICNENVYGNMQQLNNHVEICLRKHGSMDPDDEEEEETVDVEGDTYDNYQWSSPPRIPPIRISGVENHSAFHKEDGGEQLTDKDEDSSLYAPVQYSETDVTNSELNPSQVVGPQEER